MNEKVSRQDVIAVLKEWAAGQVAALDVMSWVSERYFPGRVEFGDWEGEGCEISPTNEVMSLLDSLDTNLITVDDVPILLKFLESKPDTSSIAYKEYERALAERDLEGRKVRLKNQEPYSKVLNG